MCRVVMSERSGRAQLPCSFQPHAYTLWDVERARKCSLPAAREVIGGRLAGGYWPRSERPQDIIVPEEGRASIVDQDAAMDLTLFIGGIERRLCFIEVVRTVISPVLERRQVKSFPQAT